MGRNVNLSTVLSDNSVDLSFKLLLLKDVAIAIRNLHNVNKIAHLDLKSENIIVTNEGVSQIIDLEEAQKLTGSRVYTKRISPYYFDFNAAKVSRFINETEISYEVDPIHQDIYAFHKIIAEIDPFPNYLNDLKTHFVDFLKEKNSRKLKSSDLILWSFIDKFSSETEIDRTEHMTPILNTHESTNRKGKQHTSIIQPERLSAAMLNAGGAIPQQPWRLNFWNSHGHTKQERSLSKVLELPEPPKQAVSKQSRKSLSPLPDPVTTPSIHTQCKKTNTNAAPTRSQRFTHPPQKNQILTIKLLHHFQIGNQVLID